MGRSGRFSSRLAENKEVYASIEVVRARKRRRHNVGALASMVSAASVATGTISAAAHSLFGLPMVFSIFLIGMIAWMVIDADTS